MINIDRIQAKSILAKSNLGFAKFSINPYVGCVHNCFYCYAHYMGSFCNNKNQWGYFVDIKENAPALLKKYLTNHSIDGNIAIGTVTDPYQPIEKNEKITRELLQILLNEQSQISLINDYPKITILTKNSLILRDLDLLKKFKNLEINISISNLDEKISKKIEPLASSPLDKINTLKILNENNIKSGVLIAPYLPFITNYQSIFDETKNYIDFSLSSRLNTKGNLSKILNFYNDNLNISNEKLLSCLNNKFYWSSKKEEFLNISKYYNIPSVYF